MAFQTGGVCTCLVFVFTLTTVVLAGDNNARVGQKLPATSAQFRAALTPVIEAVSRFHNVSFSIGIRTEHAELTLTAGENERSLKKQTPMTTTNKFPMGSVTKSWTASQIMQHNEVGRIDIDAPFHLYVDPIMKRLNGTTMLELWNNDPTILNISARQLMGMRAGLHDYNDTWYADWTWEHPDEDWSPFDILHRLNKTFVCAPGTCGKYASPGYELLGLALCELQNCSDWTDLDLKAVLKASQRVEYENVSFPVKGKCSKDPQVVHQYRFSVNANANREVIASHTDIVDYSCLNGWACGSIAAPVGTISNWFWDMFHGKIVSNASLTQMLNGIPLTKGWSPGLKYGLGMNHYAPFTTKVDGQNLTWTIGHGGADWGSLAAISGYNPKFNVSISFASNSVAPMNCSDEYRETYKIYPEEMYLDAFYIDAGCFVYDAVLQTIDNTTPHLNCTWTTPPKPKTKCSEELETVCGFAESNKTACLRCVDVNKTLVKNCTSPARYSFCHTGRSVTSNYTCDYNF
eukprot:m.112851 g.112851  ORF g.112851 m.112851 type:complete len:518 (-) comp28222_c1_seq2:50-1603(-)